MSLTSGDIEGTIRQKLEPVHVEVTDDSDGCGLKFSVVIVSEKFEGKPLLQRHRMVNEALEVELKSIHAFCMKTLTPKQWTEAQK